MDIQEAVNALDSLESYDPEMSHIKADAILLDFLKSNGYEGVAKAWKAAEERCDGFWYA